MTAPAQIIAAHTTEVNRNGDVDCVCGLQFSTYAGWSRHVVQVLADAGHQIVQVVDKRTEFGIERDVISGGRAVSPAYGLADAEYTASVWKGNPVVVERPIIYGEWVPAAARVVEDGA